MRHRTAVDDQVRPLDGVRKLALVFWQSNRTITGHLVILSQQIAFLMNFGGSSKLKHAQRVGLKVSSTVNIHLTMLFIHEEIISERGIIITWVTPRQHHRSSCTVLPLPQQPPALLLTPVNVMSTRNEI
jgi:hypothetical protein